MNQKDLARELCVTQSTISRWLNGKCLPKGLQAKSLEETHPELYKRIVTIYKAKNGITKN